MAELVPEVLQHLQGDDLEFFNRWIHMNSLESGEARKGSRLKNLWCTDPKTRELFGQAIGDLRIKSIDDTKVTFTKPHMVSSSIFQSGDFVLVSSMKGELALAQGTITSITSNTIDMLLDKTLSSKSEYVLDKYEYSGNSGPW